jgi:hypothetical protein
MPDALGYNAAAAAEDRPTVACCWAIDFLAIPSQIKPTPPLPALRLALLVTSLGLASMLLLDASLRCVKLVHRTQQLKRQHMPQTQQPGRSAAAAKSECATPSASPSPREAEGSSCGLTPAVSGDEAAAARDREASSSPRQQHPPPCLQPSDSTLEPRPGEAMPLRPEVPLARGLSRRVREAGRSRPRLVYYSALSATTLTFSVAFLCQVVAPGFVDAALGEALLRCGKVAAVQGRTSGAGLGPCLPPMHGA